MRFQTNNCQTHISRKQRVSRKRQTFSHSFHHMAYRLSRTTRSNNGSFRTMELHKAAIHGNGYAFSRAGRGLSSPRQPFRKIWEHINITATPIIAAIDFPLPLCYERMCTYLCSAEASVWLEHLSDSCVSSLLGFTLAQATQKEQIRGVGKDRNRLPRKCRRLHTHCISETLTPIGNHRRKMLQLQP